MSWHTGKDKIRQIAVGDSNILCTPATTLPGAIPNNPNNFFWANDYAVPYVQSGHTWRTLNPDGASRQLQLDSTFGDTSIKGDATLFASQVLGGNGSSTMAFANDFQVATGIPVYTYLGGSGASTSYDWTDWLWTQLEASLTAAWAAIPGDPAPADIIYLSMGAGDLVWGDAAFQAFDPTNWRLPYTVPTAQQFAANVLQFRSNMIAGGWWEPGVSQIIFNEIPRSGGMLSAYPAWQGLAHVMAQLNDRVRMVTSIGRNYDYPFPIHYDTPSYAAMGRDANKMALDQIPMQQSVLSIGGTRLSIGGSSLKTYSN